MNPDESALDNSLQDTSFLSSSSLEPGSKEGGVLKGHWGLCHKCGSAIIERHFLVSKKIKRRFLLGIIDNLFDPLCVPCFRKLKPTKARAATDASLRGRIKQVLLDLEGGVTKDHHDEIIKEAATRASEAAQRASVLFRQIENLNAAYMMLSQQVHSMEVGRAQILSEEYAARRKEANYVISRESLRLIVFARDKFHCQGDGTNQKCTKTTQLTVDHIIPVVVGGSDELDNLQTLCANCNFRKGKKMRKEAC